MPLRSPQNSYLTQQNFMISQRGVSTQKRSHCHSPPFSSFPSVVRVKRCGDSLSARDAACLGYAPTRGNTKEEQQQGLVLECMRCYQDKHTPNETPTSTSFFGAQFSKVAAVLGLCVPAGSEAAGSEVIKISTLEGWKTIQPTGSYQLGKDLDAKDFESTLTQPFSGTFDGNGHKIKNLRSPLFNDLGSGAVIKDFVLQNAAVTSNGDSGGLTGVGLLAKRGLGNYKIEDITFSNCKVTNTGKGQQQSTGLLLGVDNSRSSPRISGITIQNCAVNAADGDKGLLIGRILPGSNPTLLDIQVKGLLNLGSDCGEFLVGKDNRGLTTKQTNKIQARLDISSNDCAEWEKCVGGSIMSLECAHPAGAPNISELERLVKDWRFILSASVIGGVFISGLSICLTCKCRGNGKQSKLTPYKKKKVSGMDRLKTWLLTYPGSALLGAVAFLIFLKTGGSSAAAMAGFASAAISSDAKGSIAGDGNAVAGQGQNGLINVNTVSGGGGNPSVYQIVEGATKSRQVECLKKGMIFKDHTDGALLAWDVSYDGLQCWTNIPKEGQVGKCLPSAPAIRHLVRALKSVTEIDPTPNPYGRGGDQFEWPLKAEDYEVFNSIGMYILERAYSDALDPVVKMIIEYFESNE